VVRKGGVAMQTVIISSKGQISIPAKIRKALHLVKSTKLEVKVDDGRVTLTPVKDDSWQNLRGSFSGGDLIGVLEEDHAMERLKNK
jgi:AbrB family looped-hinge helix DNA binding protein